MKFLKRFEDGTCQLLWENNAPNNCTSLRPLFLIREKETDEDLLSIVIPATDNARAELASEGVCVTDNMKGYNVKIIIHHSMKDLKFQKKNSLAMAVQTASYAKRNRLIGQLHPRFKRGFISTDQQQTILPFTTSL